MTFSHPLQIIGYGLIAIGGFGCASSHERRDLISNPFLSFHQEASSEGAFTLAAPTNHRPQRIPVGHLAENESNIEADPTYKDHPPTLSDREIGFTQKNISSEEETRRREIEQGLYLKPSSDAVTDTKPTSYLARVDHIKSLYRMARYEAALLEVDELLIEYPLDSKTNEMRGTLLDRLGRRDLAIRAWNQALRLDPKNDALKRFIAKKDPSTRIPSTNAGPISPRSEPVTP